MKNHEYHLYLQCDWAKHLAFLCVHSYKTTTQWRICEISSVVEHWLPKPRVVGSNPIFRSYIFGVRNVAQLVAHYVRDVGVGRSSRLIPTLFQNNSDKQPCLSLLFFCCRDCLNTSTIPFAYFCSLRASSYFALAASAAPATFFFTSVQS